MTLPTDIYPSATDTRPPDPASARVADVRPSAQVQDSSPAARPPEVLVKSVLLRPAQMVTLVLVLLLAITLVCLGVFAWSDFERVDTIRSRVNRTRLLHESQALLKDLELQTMRGAANANGKRLETLRATLARIPAIGAPIGPVTRDRLARLEDLLARPEGPDLSQASLVVQQMLDRETAIEAQLIDAVHAHTRLAWRLVLIALVALPAMVMLGLWTVRQRVLRPANDLGRFLSRLANGDFAPVSAGDIDPPLRPLFENYNQMVMRLAQLEDQNRSRTLSLQQEVRAVTQTLLRQQQSLARAERLAAAGEVAATVAHELRNPIASIQVTLVNLRRETGDPALGERIDLVIAELQRMTRLLNGMLQQSSHIPEVPRTISVERMLQELATLIRYQLPAQIRLSVDAPADLRWRLPEDGVRQAILNLVLNAVDAIGNQPGTITIAAEQHEDGLRFAVTDDGPGFSTDILAAGVRPFLTGRDTGTGLGLAIVKRFARDLGGELHIANRSPSGATVTLALPSQRPDV
jgi:two-component system NtrC family sensor kinase